MTNENTKMDPTVAEEDLAIPAFLDRKVMDAQADVNPEAEEIWDEKEVTYVQTAEDTGSDQLSV